MRCKEEFVDTALDNNVVLRNMMDSVGVKDLMGLYSINDAENTYNEGYVESGSDQLLSDAKSESSSSQDDF